MMANNVTGLKELREKYEKISIDMRKKVTFQMALAGASVVKREAKQIAQAKGLKKSGALIANIVTKREKQVKKGVTQYNVGVRHGKNLTGKKVIKYLAVSKRTGRIITKRKNDPFYWRFLEFGTKYITPKKFIEPALESKQQAVIDAMSKTLDKHLRTVGAR
jgi:HK97 gp10 family phage protein